MRTGEEEGWNVERERESRKSKNKTINQEEKDLLDWINESGLVIRNGNIKQDKEGDYPYLGPKGHTVIDYIITRGQKMEWNDKLEVKEMIGSNPYLGFMNGDQKVRRGKEKRE